ncbi:RmlC-like cupin [Mollisia scopiformis]|uniref:RmlC-like cupin n=1 Tax=Mollisia scopiformis TaxID=149040 RepID=A0A194XFG7_MOLSC|nr:RmlC-like cupin [Mollisia scopiformis]KUJ18879.1 RmlC-like cupin [Mollisia scopiformis]
MANITKPMIVPASHTSSQPLEQFENPNRGNCTWHTIFSQPQTPTDSMCSGIGTCQPRNGRLCPHRHKQAEIYYIISGKGIVRIDEKNYEVEAGSSVFIPGDAEHGVFNLGEEDLKWFYVFPTGAFKDILYRFSDEVEGKALPTVAQLKAKL